MRTGKIQQNLAFKRALTSREKNEVKSLLQKAKEELSEDGKSILIVHEPCLPQDKSTDTGIGHLSSDTSLKFLIMQKIIWE